MLSDPEVESAVLISSDEGASFEKYPINFNILSLLFHPAQENWILAYSHDNKVASYWIRNQLLPWKQILNNAWNNTFEFILELVCHEMNECCHAHYYISPQTLKRQYDFLRDEE